MKRLFSIITLVALVFTSCSDSGDESSANLTLKLTSNSVMTFEAEGGSGTITYTLTEEATRSAGKSAITMTTDAEWITQSDTSKPGEITFNVLPNEGAKRNSLVKVSYMGGQYFNVMVEQLAAGDSGKDDPIKTVNVTATHLNGAYYGKLKTRGFNYTIILSQGGLADLYDPVSPQYRFDIYSDKTSEFANPDYAPEGVYTFGGTVGEPGTMDPGLTYCYSYGEYSITSGTLTITKDSIVADILLDNAEHHIVTYEGSLELGLEEPTICDVPQSTLTSDFEFEVASGGYIMAYYRGDYFGKDCDVWFLHMIEQKNNFSGVYLIMNIMVDKSKGGYGNKEGFVGEFPCYTPDMESCAGTFAPGEMRIDTTTLNAWYLYCDNSVVDNTRQVPIVDGTITISKEGNEYTIAIDGVDDLGHKIEGTFVGEVREYEDQSCD